MMNFIQEIILQSHLPQRNMQHGYKSNSSGMLNLDLV